MGLLRRIILRNVQLPLQAVLALRNIQRQRRRTLLTMLSMAGGYLMCAFSLSLQYGSYGNAIEFFVRDRTGHLQIHDASWLARPRVHSTIDDPAAVGVVLENTAAVQDYTTRVYASALAYSLDKKSAPVSVVGVAALDEARVSTLVSKVTEGAYLSESPGPDGYFGGLIGHGVADLLKVGVGDEIILISAGADGSIANDIFLVDGLVGSPRSADRLRVYLPLAAAQEYLSLGDSVHEFAVLLEDIGESVGVAAEIDAALPESLAADPWERIEAAFYRSMRADQQSMYLSMSILVFLVCVGVLNTVLMSILERTREFGALRAIGTRRLNITVMIVFENAWLAMFSCLAGLLLALPVVAFLAAYGIELSEPIAVGGVPMTHLRGEFGLRVFVIPALFITTTALLVSLVPGLRAARISPLEALGDQ